VLLDCHFPTAEQFYILWGLKVQAVVQYTAHWFVVYHQVCSVNIISFCIALRAARIRRDQVMKFEVVTACFTVGMPVVTFSSDWLYWYDYA
jgi:Ni/Fe-hydrogenase subunit HybB-like protein